MQNIKKYTLFYLLAIFIASVLCSCHGGSCVIHKGTENNTENSMSMVYDYMDGYKYTEFTIKEGKTVIVSFSFVTVSGELDVYLAKDNDKEKADYKGTCLPTTAFSVTVKESGKYTIRVDGRKHKGSYLIYWQEE